MAIAKVDSSTAGPKVTVTEKVWSIDSVSAVPESLTLSLPLKGSYTGTNNWKPWFLQKTTLLTFLVFLFLQTVALVALYAYSSKHHGIVPVAAKYNQAWKYGPNAILAITIVLWAQVELRAKQVTTWAGFLSDEHAKLDSDSLKTDYLSGINVVALYTSLRKRHWVVALSILIALLLQLAAVVSTSLLEREVQPLSYQLDDLRTSTAFSRHVLIDEQNFNAMETALEVISGFFGGAEPTNLSGTTDSIAFQPPVLPVPIYGMDDYKVAGSNALVTADVESIRPGVICNPAVDRAAFDIPQDIGLQSLQLEDSKRAVMLSINMTESIFSTEEEKLYDIRANLTVRNQAWTVTDLPVELSPGLSTYTVYPGCEIIFSSYATKCGPNNETIRLQLPQSAALQDCSDTTLVLLTSFCDSKAASDQDAFNTTVTILECTPDDHYGKATMKFENVREPPPPEIISLDEMASMAEKPYGNELIIATMIVTENTSGGGLGNIVANMSLSAGEDIMDAYSAKTALEAYYPFAAVQLFRATSLEPVNGSISGRIDTSISRLTVKTLSFWAMVVMMTMVTGACGAVILLSVTRIQSLSTPRNPSTLAASILLIQCHPRIADFSREISKNWNWGRKKDHDQQWWRPWGTTVFSKLVSIGAIVLAIGLLQLTYILSKRANGLVLIAVGGWGSYGWTMVPTVLATILSLMVSSVDINLRTLGPFAALADGRPTATRALFEDYLFGLLPSRLWMLGRTRRVSLAAVTIGATVMPFSMVVIGDLFVMSSEPSNRPNFQVLQVDGLDEATSQNWTTTLGGPWWPTKVGAELYNMGPLPKFATEKFVTGGYELPDSEAIQSQSLAGNSLLLPGTVTIGKLNCTYLDTQCKETRRPSYRDPSAEVPCNERTLAAGSLQWDQRQGCPLALFSTLRPYSFCHDPTGTRSFANNDSVDFNRVIDYEVSEGISSRADIASLTGQFLGAVNRTGDAQSTYDCPVLLDYGEEVIGDCGASRRSIAICDPYVESRDAHVTFSLPDLDIQNVAHAHPSSAQSHRIYGMARYLVTWQYRNFKPPLKPPPTEWADIAAVFKDAMSETSTDGTVSLDDLRNTDPKSRAKVMEGMEARWARVVAQIIRHNESSSLLEYDPPRVVNGTLIDYGRRRLIQTESSTRTLQAIFGWTALCLIGGLFFGNRNMDRVLPAPPTSVGAIIRLLEGSKILGWGDEQAEEPKREEQREREKHQDQQHTVPDISEAGRRQEAGRGSHEDSITPYITRDSGATNSPRNSATHSQTRPRSEWNDGIIPARSENISDPELRRLFDVPGRVYCLKEWEVGTSVKATGTDASKKDGDAIEVRRKRYAIDFEEEKV